VGLIRTIRASPFSHRRGGEQISIALLFSPQTLDYERRAALVDVGRSIYGLGRTFRNRNKSLSILFEDLAPVSVFQAFANVIMTPRSGPPKLYVIFLLARRHLPQSPRQESPTPIRLRPPVLFQRAYSCRPIEAARSPTVANAVNDRNGVVSGWPAFGRRSEIADRPGMGAGIRLLWVRFWSGKATLRLCWHELNYGRAQPLHVRDLSR
jgi:hypothetical protein